MALVEALRQGEDISQVHWVDTMDGVDDRVVIKTQEVNVELGLTISQGENIGQSADEHGKLAEDISNYDSVGIEQSQGEASEVGQGIRYGEAVGQDTGEGTTLFLVVFEDLDQVTQVAVEGDIEAVSQGQGVEQSLVGVEANIIGEDQRICHSGHDHRTNHGIGQGDQVSLVADSSEIDDLGDGEGIGLDRVRSEVDTIAQDQGVSQEQGVGVGEEQNIYQGNNVAQVHNCGEVDEFSEGHHISVNAIGAEVDRFGNGQGIRLTGYGGEGDRAVRNR